MAVPILNGKRDTDITDIYLKPSEKTQSLVPLKEKSITYIRELRAFYIY